MGALIQFKFRRDGKMEVWIHSTLWEVIKATDDPQTSEGFARIPFPEATEEFSKLTAMALSDQEPCRPIFEFKVP